MATEVTSMRIPTELNERYSKLAKETGRSRSYYVNEALKEAIDRLEYEYGLMKKVEDFRAGKLETVTLDELEESLGLED
jgi:RHH-type rel operon transcriptional repressor/antitoxin RelB